MSQNTSAIGRAGILNPEKNFDVEDGGTALYNALTAMFTYASNNLSARYTGSVTLANSASTSVTHNFGLATISEMEVLIFESGAVVSKKKVANSAGTGVEYIVTATNTNVLAIQNVSGGSKTFFAMVYCTRFLTSEITEVLSMVIQADSATTGANAVLPTVSRPIVRLTNASLTSIDTIPAGREGQPLKLINATGANVQINNDTGGTAANRVLTGTGAALVWRNDSALDLIYDSTSARWRIVGGTGGGGASQLITQSSHGFAVGDVLRHNGTSYVKAQANARDTADVAGMVASVLGTNTFTLVGPSYVTGLSGLTAGAIHYLSAATAGALTTTAPVAQGSVRKAVFFADSTTSGMFLNFPAEYPQEKTYEVNYLAPWFDASEPIGTVGSVTSSTGNRSSGNKDQWCARDSTTLTVSRTTTALRGVYSCLFDSLGAGVGLFVETPLFTLDAVDLGKPVSLSFDISGVVTLGDWDVVVVRYDTSYVYQETIAIGQYTASSGTPASASIPAGTATFSSFFISSSTASDRYALRFRRLSGNYDITVDSLRVGPKEILQGAAVTDWQSYTPTISNITTTAVTGRWRRIGDSVELQIAYQKSGSGTGTTEIIHSLPTGLTIDTTKLMNASGAGVVGAAHVLSGGSTFSDLWVPVVGSGNLLIGESGTTNYLRETDLSTSSYVSIRATLPVVGWSSSVSMSNRTLEEFAYNTGTWDAADTTNFGYGSLGVAMGGALTTQRNKRVRFQTPIQPTDKVTVELQVGGQWVDSDQYAPFQRQNTAQAGVQWFGVSGSSTDIDVAFSQYSELSGASFGVAGSNWTSSIRWRVRKVSSGALVGGPTSARNVLGHTPASSSDVVPTGFLAQKLDFTSRTTTGSSGSYAINTSPVVTLTPGIWILVSTATFPSNQTANYIEVGISTSNSSGGTGYVTSTGFTNIQNASAANNAGMPLRIGYAVVATDTPLYVHSFSEDAAVNVTLTGFAIRIG